MSTYNLQVEDYVKSVADSILTILTLSRNDSVRKAAWDITGVRNTSELVIRVEHDLQHFFEHANKKKLEQTSLIDSNADNLKPVSHTDDDCFSDTTSEEDMFSDTTCCFSSDDCPSTASPKYFSSSDDKFSDNEDDMFSSDEPDEFLAHGDATDSIPPTLPVDDIDEINPFVNALRLTSACEAYEDEDEDCWSQEDVPSNSEEISCFSSSSKEYMDL